jgi:hypothetical protein
VAEIVEPLAKALAEYTDDPRDEVDISTYTFEGPDARPTDAFVSLDLESDHPDFERAVWTLLEKTGASGAWLNFEGPDETNPFSGPIRFAVVEQTYGIRDQECHRYLWCNCRDQNFDAPAATRQIRNLVTLLGDRANLLPLKDEPSILV